MRKDFTDIYAATDEKFDENKFNNEVDKKIRLRLKVLRLDIYFILVTNTQNR